MVAAVRNCQAEVQALGERSDHVEDPLGEYCTSFNTLIDAHSDDILWLKGKIADFEDRSRRNTPKIRGIPETVLTSQLPQYTRWNTLKIRGISKTVLTSQLPQFVQELFSALAPALSTLELTVDRVHRVPKTSFLAEVPRDVLLRLHFYCIKEFLLDEFRKSTQLPEQYSSLRFLPDLSRHTLQCRWNLATITKAHHHQIPHKWQYPATLSITHSGATIAVSTLDEGLNALRQLGIITDISPGPSQPAIPLTIHSDWQIVTHKCSHRKRKTPKGGS